jgi:UDP-GlcNAc:undecaprenyl-phosphate GlcNAc-1-phosphate transferase
VFSFFLPLISLTIYETNVGNHIVDEPRLFIAILVGGVLITLLGIFDDIYGANAKIKFSAQFAIATGVSLMGFTIPVVDPPFFNPIHLGFFAWPAAILWIVAITNAVNLIDGLDGLAAGIALVAITPMTIISLVTGNVIMALICCTLTGSLLGFLIFNSHPARIFMGDGGSLFLGYILAIISVHTSTKGGSAVIVLIPLLTLGLPILDTALAIVRRAWYGRPLFSGDKSHIHHKLLEKGLSHRAAVFVLYGIAAAFAALALVTYLYRDFTSGLTLSVSALISAVLIYKLGYVKVSAHLTEGLAHAQAIREHNKLIREGFANSRQELSAALTIEAACVKVMEISKLVGASRAQLDLRAWDPEQPVRSWGWATESKDVDSLSFAIAVDHKTTLGMLSLYWPNGHKHHEGLVQSVEECCNSLAQDLIAPSGSATGLIDFHRVREQRMKNR